MSGGMSHSGEHINLQEITIGGQAHISSSIGQGLDLNIIKKAASDLQGALPHPDYIRFKDAPFIYEKLDGQTANETTMLIVNQWTSIPENIQRASEVVRRIPNKNRELVKAFCAFRFKKLPDNMKWKEVRLSSQKRDASTVIFIALEPLEHKNGCPIKLEIGQDVCWDGNAPVRFPGNGDGLGIFIDLNI